MAVFKCKMCGGTVEFEEGATVGVCDSCGTKQTLPKTSDDTVANMFNRANNLRLKCEFDKAEEIYGKILNEDDSEAEAHWGIVLCKYGIEYVDDPATKEKIPTCHRTLFDAITTDADYQAAIDYSDAIQQEIYEKEARRIDKIQKDILQIVQKEKPFDVFICYKETDSNGKRTVDSAIANDIYYELTEEGFKVFYAAITLEDKLGQEYEPYIFAALNSAKVMLAIGTAPENFNSVWVKNEWSRYLKLMKTDRTKLLIPCYKDMDAYELPEEFSHLQAQDMSKIGFINDITRGIKKVLAGKQEKTTTVKETVVANSTSTNVNIEPLLKRVFMFLEDKQWDSANEYCEKVLDQDPENAQAYLGKLLTKKRVSKVVDLKNVAQPFDDDIYYKKVMRFADEALVEQLKGYIEFIKARNEKTRCDGLYSKAVDLMNLNNKKSYNKALEILKTIPEWKDATEQISLCERKLEEIAKAEEEAIILAEKEAEIARKDEIYDYAKEMMKKGNRGLYICAIQKFESIIDYKDSQSQIDICKEKIAELEQEDLIREKAKKKNDLIAIIVVIITAVLTIMVALIADVIVPKINYSKALSLAKESKYEEAIEAFTKLGGYKDCEEKIVDCEIGLIKDSSVGDEITFGSYEQDDDTSNGTEDIEWIVLEKEDNRILVISKYALDCQPYNTEWISVTWETCTLRTWLNKTFIDVAFSESEQAKIPIVTVTADENKNLDTDPGNDTKDKIFLLSIDEAEQYFNSDEDRMCFPTNYAVAKGALIGDGTKPSEKATWWWLRTPGDGQDHAAGVVEYGYIGNLGACVSSNECAVRPAMWIELS